MEVPQGMDKYYPVNVLLLLLKILYVLRQYAAQFYKELLKSFRFIKYARNQADPFLYFRWVKGELVICIPWLDDCLLAGPNKRTQLAKIKMMSLVECEEMGEMKEYIGCKIERNWNERWVKLKKLVMVQSFQYKF